MRRKKGRTKCFLTADGPEMLEEHETWQLRVMIERPTMCFDEKNQFERWGLFACNVHIYVCTSTIQMQDKNIYEMDGKTYGRER